MFTVGVGFCTLVSAGFFYIVCYSQRGGSSTSDLYKTSVFVVRQQSTAMHGTILR